MDQPWSGTGADLLIKALSELYLTQEGQLSTNTLRLVAASGATLILAEPALEEIYTHIVAADAEFRNYYVEIEPVIDENICRRDQRSRCYRRHGGHAG